VRGSGNWTLVQFPECAGSPMGTIHPHRSGTRSPNRFKDHVARFSPSCIALSYKRLRTVSRLGNALASDLSRPPQSPSTDSSSHFNCLGSFHSCSYQAVDFAAVLTACQWRSECLRL